MRTLAILVASLVAMGGLAGCIGGEKEVSPDEDITSTDTNVKDGTTPQGTTAPQLKVLAPLSAAITIDAPAWVQTGTEVPVSLTTPANAKGSVSYAWAIGALPGTVEVDAFKADTGSKGSDYIQPGATKSITYGAAGIFRMHCHPHPDMRHNVTVIDGYAGPKTVDVFITDGADRKEYRFVPENIVVGVNTTVNYKNVGSQPHTSTALGAQEPPLKLLPLQAESGNVKIEGEGWQRIVAVYTDGEGRLGVSEQRIYATATLPSFEARTESFEFTYGAAPLAGTPAEAAAKSVAVTLEQGGLVNLTYAFKDALAANGAPENLAQVAIHFTKDGETQDTLTGEPDPEGALSGKAGAGAYTLKVVPLQGAEITGTVTIEVVYELVPPEPEMPAADEGHGGHGGHAH